LKTILISGINGYLGKHLATQLSKNHQILGLEYSAEKSLLIEDDHFTIYNTYCDNWVSLLEQNSIDIIIHTATFYGINKDDMSPAIHTNLIMPIHLLDGAIRNGVSMFINTDTVLNRFVNPYALTKRQFQEWLFFRKNEIRIVNIKLEHFYGPGCSKSNFITAMIERLRSNESSIDLTNGEQQRNFVFIEDVISAFETVIMNHPQNSNYYEYHIATPELITIKELMITMKTLLNSNSQLIFGAIPYRDNELNTEEFNNINLRKIGWRPQYDIISGLKKTFG
jgi:CDP-paratose synthetase